MEYMLIEKGAYEDLLLSVNTLVNRVKQLTEAELPDRWMSCNEVCKTLKISKSAFHYYRYEGIIPYSTIGNKVFVRERDLSIILSKNLIKTRE